MVIITSGSTGGNGSAEKYRSLGAKIVIAGRGSRTAIGELKSQASNTTQIYVRDSSSIDEMDRKTLEARACRDAAAVFCLSA
ncbi:MAG TPA: hypothetical protein VFC63_10145 [Blastocatellia bacterium]|nr:hypothetical protein [Blastocatellia bacterium]